ncbi:hypothetical protein D9M68_760170 [compost metagenome]
MSFASTPCASCRWTPCRTPTAATRACRWPRRRWPMCSGSRLWLAYPTCGGRQWPAGDREGAACRPCRDESSVPDPGAHASRLWVSQQAGQLRGSWLAAWRGRGATDQAESWLAGRTFLPYTRVGAPDGRIEEGSDPLGYYPSFERRAAAARIPRSRPRRCSRSAAPYGRRPPNTRRHAARGMWIDGFQRMASTGGMFWGPRGRRSGRGRERLAVPTSRAPKVNRRHRRSGNMPSREAQHSRA